MRVDTAALERAYYDGTPDPTDPAQRVAFGTSGHRGSPFAGSFTEAHILAITQSICEYRKANGIGGPLIMGKDTHAASAPAQRTALEVLAANSVETYIQSEDGFAPTPVISRAILVHNRDHADKGGSACRRYRHNPIAQPATRWRLQIQPTRRRPGRHIDYRVGARPCQRIATRWQPRREAHAI